MEEKKEHPNKVVTRNISWPVWLRDSVNEISEKELMSGNTFIIQAIKKEVEKYQKKYKKDEE